MRTANVLKATRQIADEALYRSSFNGGGGLPTTTFTIMVNKGGNDGTGDGTDERPFLTWGKALSFAASLNPSVNQFALVLGGPGTYNENLALPPFVFVSSLDPGGNAVTIGTGIGPSITLAGWNVPPGGAFGGIEAMFTVGDVVLDYTGIQAFSDFTAGAPLTIGGALSVIGDAAQPSNTYLPPGSSVGAPVSIVGSNFTTQGVLFTLSTVRIASTATQPGGWTSEGDVVTSTVTLDASAGQNVAALMNSYVTGALTLHDGGGGVTSYSATAGGIPSTVTRIGGAAAPVPQSPLVGTNSTNPTGVAAVAGTVATADGTNGVTWSPAPGAFSPGGILLSTTGLTTFLVADLGVFNNAGAVAEWFDQTPSRAGEFWSTIISTTHAATFNAAGFNGKATIDTVEGANASVFEYKLWGGGAVEGDAFVKPDEFTLACCIEYTGTKIWAASQLNPIIFAASNTGGGTRDGCGLTVGVDNGDATMIFFSAFANVDAVAVTPFVQSVAVPKNVPHYVVATFLGGVLSIYVDNLAVVTTAAVSPMTPSSLAADAAQIAAGGSSASQQFQGHIRAVASWCVGQTGAALAATQATMKSLGGL